MRRLLPLVLLATVLSASRQPATAQLPAGTTPFTIGVIDTVSSAVLGERRILNIYLPEGYSTGDTARYPVIYLLDGSRDEDFIHIAGLVQYGAFPWVGYLRPSIVVGIANVDRKRDFTMPTAFADQKKLVPTGGGSPAFLAFLETELQPFVERRYRTGPSRTLIGQSLGGLFASEVLLRKPSLFDRYIILSPSLWWNDGAVLRLPLAPLQQVAAPTQVYIGVGKEGAAPGPRRHIMEEDAKQLADRVRTTGNPALQVHFDYLPGEDHATIGHQAVLNAFRLLHKDGSRTK